MHFSNIIFNSKLVSGCKKSQTKADKKIEITKRIFLVKEHERGENVRGKQDLPMLLKSNTMHPPPDEVMKIVTNIIFP